MCENEKWQRSGKSGAALNRAGHPREVFTSVRNHTGLVAIGFADGASWAFTAGLLETPGTLLLSSLASHRHRQRHLCLFAGAPSVCPAVPLGTRQVNHHLSSDYIGASGPVIVGILLCPSLLHRANGRERVGSRKTNWQSLWNCRYSRISGVRRHFTFCVESFKLKSRLYPIDRISYILRTCY